MVFYFRKVLFGLMEEIASRIFLERGQFPDVNPEGKTTRAERCLN